MALITWAQELPKINDVMHLHIHEFCTADSGLIFEFKNFKHQVESVNRLVTYLKASHPEYGFSHKLKVPEGDEYLSQHQWAKTGVLFTTDIDAQIKRRTIKVPYEGDFIECRLSKLMIETYTFNTHLIHFNIDIPEGYWQNVEAIRQINFYLNGWIFDEPGVTKFHWDDFFYKEIHRFVKIVANAVHELGIPNLKAPFVDIKKLTESEDFILARHVVLQAVFPKEYDFSQRHYQSAMNNTCITGVIDQCKNNDDFIFTESHNSLFCVKAYGDTLSDADLQHLDRWLFWMAHHQSTYKMAVDLDKILTAVLNSTIGNINEKVGAISRDIIYQMNVFLNYTWQRLDAHHLDNLYIHFNIHAHSIDDIESYLRQAQKNWRTDMTIDSVNRKIARLQRIIDQMFEFSNVERSGQVEKILSILGIFGLGNFLVGYHRIMSYTKEIGDLESSLLLFGVLTAFALCIVRLIK